MLSGRSSTSTLQDLSLAELRLLQVLKRLSFVQQESIRIVTNLSSLQLIIKFLLQNTTDVIKFTVSNPRLTASLWSLLQSFLQGDTTLDIMIRLFVPYLGNRGHILLGLCRGNSYSSCCLTLSVHVPAEQQGEQEGRRTSPVQNLIQHTVKETQQLNSNFIAE